ncbi:MAG: tripartite tricarboxylate transporter substrate binding protein [Spirochaetes bacterium]|nr:tripartite tricarboxylate transporter substrate binding protein [Spirochaetota bacterium]
MKKFILTLSVLALALSPLMARGAGQAGDPDNWPTRPINMVVAFGPGGNSDFNARTIARHLSADLGVPIVITNVGAAGGTVAAAQVRGAAPDGYTVLVHQLSLNVATAAGVIDFSFEDLETVCVFSRAADEVLAVRADSPWNNIQELIAASQASPGTIRLAANTGASTHWIAIAMQHAGGQFNVVSAGGSGERIPLLLGNHMDVIPIQINMIEDFIATGQFRVLATVSAQRSPLIPDVPTLLEQGVDVSYSYYNTFFMPRGTDPQIIARLSQAVRRVVEENAEYAQEIESFAQTPFWMDTQPTVQHFAEELRNLMGISHILRGGN